MLSSRCLATIGWVILAGTLSACPEPVAATPTPSTPTPSTPTDTGSPACAVGTEVEFEGARWNAAGECLVSAVFPVLCDAITVYLEEGEVDPPEFPCTPEPFTFTELATGDCLRLFPRCPGVLDDPRYGDCSLADDEQCCPIGEEQVAAPGCDDVD